MECAHQTLLNRKDRLKLQTHPPQASSEWDEGAYKEETCWIRTMAVHLFHKENKSGSIPLSSTKQNPKSLLTMLKQNM